MALFADDSEGKEGSSSYLFSNLLLTMSTRISLLSGEMKEFLYKSTGKFEIDTRELPQVSLQCKLYFAQIKDFKDNLQK